MSAAVALRAVTKRYESFTAVDSLSFEIPRGSVFGLLGPNGAGKTSSIRMMMGIILPDEGEIRLFDEPFRREHLGRIGYLPEERGLYKKMKVLDHLVFLAQLKGLTEAESRKRAISWCERLGLAEWSGKKVDELSKGMQQKVQFIATLIHDPEFVIMDEPFSGLDPANSVQMKDILLELRKQGKTVLFSTHRMDQVERLCDSICLLNGGKAVLIGELKQVKNSYGKNSVQVEYDGDDSFLHDRNLVASFNNYGNFVEARLSQGADPQELLRLATAAARISRFQLMEPSLEEIFIDVVRHGGQSVQASNEPSAQGVSRA